MIRKGQSIIKITLCVIQQYVRDCGKAIRLWDAAKTATFLFIMRRKGIGYTKFWQARHNNNNNNWINQNILNMSGILNCNFWFLWHARRHVYLHACDIVFQPVYKYIFLWIVSNQHIAWFLLIIHTSWCKIRKYLHFSYIIIYKV